MIDIYIDLTSIKTREKIKKMFPNQNFGNFEPQACDICITDSYGLWMSWKDDVTHHDELHRDVWQAKSLIYVSTNHDGELTLTFIS